MTIQERINEILLAEQEKSLTRVRSGLWSPSSFGGCYRKQYWNRKNEPKSNPPDERSLRVFKAGHFFHDFVQKIVAEQCPTAQIEQEVREDDVLGFADIVLDDEVVEVKSQHSNAFWWMTKSDEPITQQKPDHTLQAGFYAMTLGKEWFRLVYVSKDDLCVQEYKVKLTDEIKGRVESELAALREVWEKDVLPEAKPRLYVGKDGKSKECSYCNWKTKCEEIENGNKSKH